MYILYCTKLYHTKLKYITPMLQWGRGEEEDYFFGVQGLGFLFVLCCGCALLVFNKVIIKNLRCLIS